MIIPKVLGEQWQKRARVGNSNKLKTIMELRDFIAENSAKILAYGKENFYKDVADWNDCAPTTIKDWLSTARSYPDEKLIFWIEKSGYGFDHIDTANSCQDRKGTLYTNASFLLDESIKYGNEHGKRMTVVELEEFAMGGKKKATASLYFSVLIQKAFSKLILGIPTSWDESKRKAFEAFLADTRQKMQDDFFNE